MPFGRETFSKCMTLSMSILTTKKPREYLSIM